MLSEEIIAGNSLSGFRRKLDRHVRDVSIININTIPEYQAILFTQRAVSKWNTHHSLVVDAPSFNNTIIQNL